MATSKQILMVSEIQMGPLRQHRVFAMAVAICLLAMIVLPGFAAAQDDTLATQETVKVGLCESPPFVMPGSAEDPQGMAVDLWKKLAEGLGLTSDYTVSPSISELRKGHSGAKSQSLSPI